MRSVKNGVMKESWMIAFANFAAQEICCWASIWIAMVKATIDPVIDRRIDKMIPAILMIFFAVETLFFSEIRDNLRLIYIRGYE